MQIVSHGGEGAHGPWCYAEWRPPPLAGAVDLVWTFTGPSVHPRKRVLPNGRLELLLNFSEPYRLVAGTGSARLERAFIGGVASGPMVVAQPSWQDVMGIRLRPAAAYTLLAAPMGELADQVLGVDDVLGPAVGELVERCAAARTPRERFALAMTWVAQRLAAARRRPHPALLWSARQIEQSAGSVAIAALRAETGWSKSRLTGVFREQIGLVPKRYARVVRFARARALLQAGDASLVEVALAAGYYDQPHMNADFRELGGIAPSVFLATRHPVGDGSTAAELG